MAWLFPRNPPLLLLIMHQHTHAAGTKLGVHFQRGRGKRRYGGEKVRVKKNWRVRWKKNIEGALTALFTHAIAWRVTQASIIGVGQVKNQTLSNYCQQNGLQGAWLGKMWKHMHCLSLCVFMGKYVKASELLLDLISTNILISVRSLANKFPISMFFQRCIFPNSVISHFFLFHSFCRFLNFFLTVQFLNLILFSPNFAIFPTLWLPEINSFPDSGGAGGRVEPVRGSGSQLTAAQAAHSAVTSLLSFLQSRLRKTLRSPSPKSQFWSSHCTSTFVLNCPSCWLSC